MTDWAYMILFTCRETADLAILNICLHDFGDELLGFRNAVAERACEITLVTKLADHVAGAMALNAGRAGVAVGTLACAVTIEADDLALSVEVGDHYVHGHIVTGSGFVHGFLSSFLDRLSVGTVVKCRDIDLDILVRGQVIPVDSRFDDEFGTLVYGRAVEIDVRICVAGVVIETIAADHEIVLIYIESHFGVDREVDDSTAPLEYCLPVGLACVSDGSRGGSLRRCRLRFGSNGSGRSRRLNSRSFPRAGNEHRAGEHDDEYDRDGGCDMFLHKQSRPLS